MKTKTGILLVILTLCQILFTQNVKAQNYATIDVDSAQSLIQYHELNPNFIILDVRRQSEYVVKHIENGVQLDYFLTNFNEILDTLIKDKIYLVHCASGGRSGNAFNSMQTMGFTDVYNMAGGLNAWEAASKPITVEVSPILLPVSDSIVDFEDIDLGYSGLIDVTITNYGNDTLDFTNITDLTGTPFSTNFNLNARLTGLMDYTFQITYIPTAIQADSLVFQIESDGGLIDLVLKGEGIVLDVPEYDKRELSVYPNPSRAMVTIEQDEPFSVELINVDGKSVYNSSIWQPKQVFNFAEQKRGVYILRVNTRNTSIARKLILY